MFKRVLFIFGALIPILLVVIATRPDSFTVSRSTIVAAAPAVVYAQVSDFAAWQAWSPWAKLDPAMKTTFAGQTGQPGATYAWTGNDKVGEGRMTIVTATAPSLVDIKLEFLKPFAATNDTTFAITPSGTGSLVVWTMSGNNNFMAKGMSLFMSMDKMIGGDFERGLSQLKTVSEAEAAKAAAAVPAAASPVPVPAPAAAVAPAPVKNK